MQTDRAILLTPPGPAAIAVVRLVGPGVAFFLEQHFSKPAKAGQCVHGVLADGDRVIDDPVIVLLRGAGGVDVNLHGGPWVVRSFLDLAAKDGFEIGDHSDPTVAHQATDGDLILQREAAAALPAARTELGLRVLLQQEQAWRQFIKRRPSAEEIRQVLADVSLRHLLDPPTVAIVGVANVGKSTLANQLFGQERSITADLPGTTRDWVGEIANIDGLPVMLVDTPGQRATADAIEQAAIERSRWRIEQANCIVLVLDATRPMAPEQAAMVGKYPQAICAANKSDQPLAWPMEHGWIPTVATSGQGVHALRQAIAEWFCCAGIDPEQPRWWTARQEGILERALTTPDALEAI